jgi:hypothetical protein
VVAGGGGGAIPGGFGGSAGGPGGAGLPGWPGELSSGHGGTAMAPGKGGYPGTSLAGGEGGWLKGGVGATIPGNCGAGPGSGGGGSGAYGGGGGAACITGGGGGGASIVNAKATLLYGPAPAPRGTAPGVSITFSVPAVSLSASALRFASHGVGGGSGGQALRVTNFGAAPLIVSGVLLRGRDAGDFRVHDDCRRPLARGASCVVTVRFVALGTGSRSATLTLLTNAAKPPAAVWLRGTRSGPVIGTQRPKAHRVALIICARDHRCAARVVTGIATFTAVGSRVVARLLRGTVVYASGARVMTHTGHELVVNERRALKPGVYMLMLRTRSERTRSVRVAIRRRT